MSIGKLLRKAFFTLISIRSKKIVKDGIDTVSLNDPQQSFKLQLSHHRFIV